MVGDARVFDTELGTSYISKVKVNGEAMMRTGRKDA